MSRPTAPEVTLSENAISSSDASIPKEADEKATKNDSAKAAGAVPSKRPFLDAFPPWVSTNLRSSSSWKLLARCWLAAWAAFLIMDPQPSLAILGNTYVAMPSYATLFTTQKLYSAFFGVMAAMFLPPFLPIQMFLLVSTQFFQLCYYILLLDVGVTSLDDLYLNVWCAVGLGNRGCSYASCLSRP